VVFVSGIGYYDDVTWKRVTGPEYKKAPGDTGSSFVYEDGPGSRPAGSVYAVVSTGGRSSSSGSSKQGEIQPGMVEKSTGSITLDAFEQLSPNGFASLAYTIDDSNTTMGTLRRDGVTYTYVRDFFPGNVAWDAAKKSVTISYVSNGSEFTVSYS